MNGLGRIATDAGRVVVMVDPTAEEPEHAPYFLGQEPA